MPGIVAAVSGALGEQGCNLEDSTMTILQGHFAILLVVTAPEGTTAGSTRDGPRTAAETLRPGHRGKAVEGSMRRERRSASAQDSESLTDLGARGGPARHRPCRRRSPRRARVGTS